MCKAAMPLTEIDPSVAVGNADNAVTAIQSACSLGSLKTYGFQQLFFEIVVGIESLPLLADAYAWTNPRSMVQ